MANLKSVQKGVFTLAAAENVATETLTAAVDPTKTILFKGGVRIDDEGDRPSHTNIMVSLTDATTITFERIDSHNAEVKISWYVVEFEEGVRVERGTENFSGQSTKTDDIDNATDLAKSFCLISYKTDGHHFGPDDFCRSRLLDDGGQKKIEMSFAGATVGKVDWQVIEIEDGGEVQSGLVNLAGSKAMRDVNISDVDLTKSFLVFSYKVNGEANPDALAIRGHISDTDKLTFERNSSSSGISADISWFVVQMTDGTSMQQKDITLAAGDEKGDTAIDPVTIDETSVHIGSLQQFGKNERNVDEFGKAMITVDLESPTKVNHIRGQANSAAGIWTFYVIQWAKGGESMFIKGVRKPNRKGKSIENPNLGDEHTILTLRGSGIFISAEISKRLGDTDDTLVIMEIDGSDNKVVRYSFQKGLVEGLVEDNDYGISLLLSENDTEVKTLTIGFDVPLFFQNILRLYVQVQENNVSKIVGNVVFADYEPEDPTEEILDSGGEIP